MENKELVLKNISELSARWNQLRLDLLTRNKVEMDAFKAVFSETYQALKDVTVGAQIEREYLGLILSANNFANLPCNPDSDILFAQLALTERMLHYCTLDEVQRAAFGEGIVCVYILKKRKEIKLDLKDIEGSLEKLIDVLGKNWDCV